VELPAPELPPDGSVWIVESPDDLEGREVDLMVDHAERLGDGMLSVSLRPVQQQ
jgi:hypothetical protein